MLRRIHVGHFGVKKCRSRARLALFWPGMNAVIEKTVTNYNTFQTHRHANQTETLLNHPIFALPWQVVASDLFHFDGRDYVLVVDYYSNYPEVEYLRDTTSTTVISKIKGILACHGRCQKLVSDNGPQFSEFWRFSKQCEFVHTTSSPAYPTSIDVFNKDCRRSCSAILTWVLENVKISARPLNSIGN